MRFPWTRDTETLSGHVSYTDALVSGAYSGTVAR